METKVRPEIRSDRDSHEPRKLRLLLLAVGAVAAAVVVLAGPSAPQPAPEPRSDEPVAAIVDEVDPIGRDAIATVRAFEEATAAGEMGEALATFAPDPVWIELPGALTPARNAAELEARWAFVSDTSSFRLGPCRADAVDAGASDERRVTCSEAAVEGSYAAGLGRDGSEQRIAFGVKDHHIVSMFWSRRGGEALLTHSYCGYARDSFPDLAAGAFDESCMPREVPAAGAAHAEMAAAFLAAGRPLLDEAGIATRSREIVEEFFAAHDAGGDPFAFVAGDFFVVRYPGLLLRPDEPPFPSFSDFLEWSAAVYTVELGDCTARLLQTSWPVRVDCPDARWGGPLPEALGLGSVAQPVSVWVDDFAITGFIGDTVFELDASVRALCAATMGSDDRAARAFRDDCVVVHDAAVAPDLISLAAAHTVTR